MSPPCDCHGAARRPLPTCPHRSGLLERQADLEALFIVALLLLALFGIAVARVFTNIARKEPVALLPDQRLLQGGPTRVVDSTRAYTDEP
ncbi:MAG TPA: hypothetical protein VID72_06790 [Ktedonobacterales bacterium]